MAIREYSIKELGRNYKVSPHFTLREFQSRDGADIVKIDDRLLALGEALRSILGGDEGRATVGVNSGYRTPTYNKKVRGASKSRHTYGDAMDIVCKQDGKRVSGKIICCIAAELGFNGVALIKGTGYSVHVDTYTGRTYRGDENIDYSNNVPNGNFLKYFELTQAKVDAFKVSKVEEEDDMATFTQEKFNEYMDAYLSGRAEEKAQSWSAEDRKWAEDLGLIKGDGTGMNYRGFLTREEMIVILSRFADLLTASLKK